MKEEADLIINLLRNIGGEATFDEIYRELVQRRPDLRKIDVRRTLSELVRKGVIERVPGYERKCMVFRLKDNK